MRRLLLPVSVAVIPELLEVVVGYWVHSHGPVSHVAIGVSLALIAETIRCAWIRFRPTPSIPSTPATAQERS